MAASPTAAAVRAATQVRANRAKEIRAATPRLLGALLAVNHFTREQIVSALFTATPDLDADFPAHASRRLGWTSVPLLGAQEIPVPGAPARIVRVLLTLRDVPPGHALTPIYLDGAAALRPDLASRGDPTVAHGPPRRVTLAGLGQIGGSIGLALGARGGWERTGW